MITGEDREVIRKAYYLEHKGIRQIAREYHHSRRTIRHALQNFPPQSVQRSRPKPAPVFGSFKARVETLLAHNQALLVISATGEQVFGPRVSTRREA